MITKEVTVLMLVLGVASGMGQIAPSQDGVAYALPQGSVPPPGGYRMEEGMTAPKIVQAVAAVYPEAELASGDNGQCTLSMEINAEGMPLFIHVAHSAGEAFDAAAIYAVRQSKFEAGVRQQKAVPVRAMVRVAFTADHAQAIPEILKPVYPPPENAVKADVPPKIIQRADAEFSEEARRKKINGVVVISFLVNEEGMPADLRVVSGAGYGLDEKAMEAVRKYRFKPAMKDGKPIAQRISIEISFRMFQ